MVLDPGTLRRQYLSKLSDDLRQAVLNKMWSLDGENAIPRKPKTWEEVSEVVDVELSTRADTKAPREMLAWNREGGGGSPTVPPKSGSGGGGGGSKGCRVCQSKEHQGAMCPTKAARLAGEEEFLLAKSAKTGETCSICGAAAHRKKHHYLAAQSYCQKETGYWGTEGQGNGSPPVPAGAGAAQLRPVRHCRVLARAQ